MLDVRGSIFDIRYSIFDARCPTAHYSVQLPNDTRRSRLFVIKCGVATYSLLTRRDCVRISLHPTKYDGSCESLLPLSSTSSQIHRGSRCHRLHSKIGSLSCISSECIRDCGTFYRLMARKPFSVITDQAKLL